MLSDLVELQPAAVVGAERRDSTPQNPGKGKVVLFLPPYAGPPLGPPVGLLALASPLQAAGYQVKIIDGAVTPGFLDAIQHEASDALCLGVSLLTGPMIEGAVAASRLVKQTLPDLPIVFGGWHPSLLPEQTVQEPFVDAVALNQGELTFLEMVRRFDAGDALDGVAGCWFKRGETIVRNPDRPVTRIRDLPPPAYDLVDFDSYGRSGITRKLPYPSSVGCPYACTYCTDTVFYQRRFNAYPAERVVAEVTDLVKRHRIEEVSFLDSNFLVDTKRAVKIAEGFLTAGLDFRWTFQASTDLLCRMSDEEVQFMARSGLAHIGFGTESGSEEVLAMMNKPHQTIPDMFETARKAKQAGIRLTFNLIFGYPGETATHRRETLRVMAEITRRFDNVKFSPNLFSPYPGIAAWPELERRGVRQPDSLQGWKHMALGAGVLPWMQGEPFDQVRRSMSLLLLANEINKTAHRAESRTQRWLWGALRRPLSWRLKHQFFRWPFEVWLYEMRKKLVMRRSLLTGQDLSYSIEHVG